MIEFRKCHPEHILLVQAQLSQRSEYASNLGSVIGTAANHGVSYSGWVNHRCVGAAGLFPIWRKAVAWAILSNACAPHMRAITRKALKVIPAQGFERIEAMVLCDFAPGHRWARMLGFVMEAERMRRYDPDGRDMALYAWVRE